MEMKRIILGRSLFLLVSLQNFILCAYADVRVEDIVAYWAFEGSLGDLVGGHHGAAHGDSLNVKYVQAKQGRGLRLDGTDQWIDIPNGLPSHALSFAVSLWIKPEGSLGTILGWETSGWRLRHTPDGSLLLGEDEAVNVWEAHEAAWHHIVFTGSNEGFSGSSALYVDGVLQYEGRSPFQGEWELGREITRLDMAPFAIGGQPSHRDVPFHGVVDELIFFRRILTEAEILTLWNNGEGTNFARLITGIDEESDSDDDGISDGFERLRGMNPHHRDTDGDGISDDAETKTNPLWPDTDHDGLLDGEELALLLDPLNPDSDNDLFSDGCERLRGSNPLESQSTPDMAEGLIAYWPFDHSLHDVIGGHHGVLYEGTPKFEDGLTGSALSMDGDQAVQVQGLEGAFAFKDSSFTIALWCQTNVFTDSTDLTQLGLLLAFLAEPIEWRFLIRKERDSFRGLSLTQLQFNQHQRHSSGPAAVFEKQVQHHIAITVDAAGASEQRIRTLLVNGTPIFPFQDENVRFVHVGSERGLWIGGLKERGWIGLLDDVAIWNRALTESEIRYLATSGRALSDQFQQDADKDGLPTIWELKHGLNTEISDGNDDPDGDGLTNRQEFDTGTSPTDPDTDHDGAPDLVETGSGRWISINDRGTNPFRVDSDSDGLSDGTELKNEALLEDQWPTDPNIADTDSDGFDDGTEVRIGTDPADPHSRPNITEGLIAYWPLDWTTEDLLGVYHATEIGGPIPFQQAEFGNGLHFNGRTHYLEVASELGPLERESESFSISAWIRADPHFEPRLNTFAGLAGRSKRFREGWQVFGTSQEESPLYITLETNAFFPAVTQLEQQGFQAIERAHGFHHVVGVMDAASGLTLTYVDGKQSGRSRNAAFASSDAPFRIGTFTGEMTSNVHFHWAGVLDEVAVWARTLTEGEVQLLYESERSLGQILGRDTKPLVKTVYLPAKRAIEIRWDSVASQFYSVESSSNLLDWQTLVRSYPREGATGASTVYLDEVFPKLGVPQQFYRIRPSAPPPLFEDGFESKESTWEVTSSNDGTAWEQGRPSLPGPMKAFEGEHVWGTDLDGEYRENTDTRLRSPVIDLNKAQEPTLSFHYYLDASPFEGGQLNFLTANGNLITSHDDLFQDTTDGWVSFMLSIPDAVLERGLVRLEFRFASDGNDDVGAGWYVDDVRILNR